MMKRFEQLGFIIGVFFILLAFILLGGYLITDRLHAVINLYTGITFLVFGGAMLFVKEK